MSRQISLFEIEMVKAWFSFVYDARPDWLRNYFVFSKAILFIWGLVLGHSVVEYATVCMLMIYLVNVLKKHLLLAAIIINILDGVSGLLALSVAYVADAYTDRFSVIVFTSASYIMGLILLWLAACQAPDSSICYVAIFLIALGKSGRGSTLQSFFKYQMNSTVKNTIGEDDDQNKTRDGPRMKRRREVGTKIWWYSAWILGYAVAIFSSGMVIKPHSPEVFSLSSFEVITGVMLLASFLFFYGFSFYDYENPTKRPLGLVFKVLKEAISNKLHLWVSFFSFGVVLTTGNTLFITQITNMNLNLARNVMVPIPFFFVLKSFISDLVIFLFWWRDPTKKSVKVIRIGAAMICSVICCIAARQVELDRLHIIRKELIEDPLKMSSMSVLWLIPQFFFLGLMEGLGGGALVTHFNGHVPESMRSFAEPFSELVVCVGKFCSIFFILICNFWFGQNINVSKVDRYFLVLAILCSLSFFFYLFWCWNFDNDSSCENTENLAGIGNGEGVPEELNDESVEESEDENMEGTIESVQTLLDNVQEIDSASENTESNQAGMKNGEEVPEELDGESVEEAGKILKALWKLCKRR